MYSGLSIPPPFFEIGPKAYIYGARLLELARHADDASRKYDVRIIFTPQTVDIPLLAREMRNVMVFAQHMDALSVGRGMGAVLPEAIREAGAVGVMLNHVEHRIPHDLLERTIRRADQVGLATIACADTLEEAALIARMQPNVVLVESPGMIEAGGRNEQAKAEIARVNQAVWDVNPEIRVLHGAGIQSGQDVYDVIAAGAQAAGSTSGILLAKDPVAMLDEMIHAVRSAWDDMHK
ncbi:MAG: triose-phosphate isomerase [Anaerolineaceae bacterium]